MKIQDKYFIDLLYAALHHTYPPKLPKEVSWEGIYEQSLRHSVTSLIYQAVRNLKEGPPSALAIRWKEDSDKALAKELTFDAMRFKILEDLEREEIRYMPLKGIQIKEYYEMPGLRQFADNDIFFDREKWETVREIMGGYGFSVLLDEEGQDVYQKKPIYNFEFHRSIMEKRTAYYAYFEQAWERAVKDEGNNYGYHMKEEDLYVYVIVHFYKHYKESGCGIRPLIDIYLIWQQLSKSINSEDNYIHTQLEILGLVNFEKEMRELSYQLFERREPSYERVYNLSHSMETNFDYLITCGIYGTRKIKIDNGIQGKGKERYFFSRIFIRKQFMHQDYPVLQKLPWLLPAAYIYRLIFAVIKKRQRVMLELKSLHSKP